jgi:tetratricopeptide (TPR) repeat protein
VIDGSTPVAQLCAAGMQAEREGRNADALDAYLQAWAASRDDYEAAIAAHFLARQQPTATATLHWNRVALDRALAAGDERVRGFFPSLYLNLGYAHEQLGDVIAARRCYEAGAKWLDQLANDPYAAVVRGGLERALERTHRYA